MDDERLKRAIELAKEATLKDEKKEYEEAFRLYRQSLEHWFLVIKYQPNPALKKRLQEKMEEYTARAEAIHEFLNNQKQLAERAVRQKVSAEDSTEQDATNDDTKSDTENDEKHKLKGSIASVIMTSRPNINWNDVAGLEAAKAALREAVVLPLKFPKLFTGKRTPWRGILLYGPPGTGKTHLAKACATETQSTFLCVSSADLMSKWQGESEKLVRAMFETARESKPSVIFIDEIDSIGGARSEHDSESSRRVKTEFLVQMDGLSNDGCDILILGATNVPWDLDAAIRRRFERRVYIPLPDFIARRKLIEISIGSSKTSLTLDDMSCLASQLDGFSGSDIAVLVRDAMLQGVRKLSTATHFRRSDDNSMWLPCSPDAPFKSKKEISLMEIDGNELETPELSMVDFSQAILNARASVAKEDLQRYRDWTDKYGLEGS